MAQDSSVSIDPNSGFCKSNSIFYSKRQPLPLPSNESLDITTFISSQPHQGNIAFIDASTGHQLTYTQLWRLVDSVSSGLSNLGIRKGHVILILSPNSIFFPIICLSVMSLGAIITTTNPLNTAREIGVQIADSKPILAFTTQSLLPKLTGLNDLPIVLIGENNIINSDNKARIAYSLEDMMKKEPSQNLVKDRVNQDDTASLMYSSGTTGKSKGVLLSHKNLIIMVQNVVNRIQSTGGNQTLICTIPMFHMYGLSWFAIGLLASGSTTVMLSRFDLKEILSAITKYSVTFMPVAPPVVVALVNNADKIRVSSRYNLGSLKWVISGGAPLSKEVIEKFLGLYPGVKILQGYALTETTAVGASNDLVEEKMRHGSAGLLSASFEAKIVDPKNGKALSVNQTGELWLRGPLVMKGYLNNPEATASTLDSEGWLKTGDLCYIDDDGYLFVVDRLKDLIKYKAYQVPPAELEAVLLTHPEIADAAVIPFPDEEVGQFPMAYVVRKEGSNLSESMVMDFVVKQVAPYKKIRRVTFIEAIPKNPSGKILRKNLIKLATSKL